MAVQTITEYQMFIAGEWTTASGGEWVDVRNPASGEVIARVPSATRADVDRAVAAARAAFRDSRWRGLWIPERVAILNRLADLIDANTEELARLESLQTGTALKLRRDSDVPFAADNLRFFATALQSGFGKDMSSYAFEEYTQVKHVMVELTGEAEKGWHYTVVGDPQP